MIGEEAFPGYNEDIKLEEFEVLVEHVNGKYGTKTSALQVRAEFEDAYNKLFDAMMVDYSDRVFDIIYLFMDEFNINETKAVRYLNEDNTLKVRNFAKNNFCTDYYEKKEQAKEKAKAESKGKTFFEHDDISSLFE